MPPDLAQTATVLACLVIGYVAYRNADEETRMVLRCLVVGAVVLVIVAWLVGWI